MAYYYCTCSTDPNKKRAVQAGRSPFREVGVTSEGACITCGYYAVAYFERIDPTLSKLYDKINNAEVKPPPLNVVGGLSLANIKKEKKRKVDAERRKSEDGDLDV